MTDSPTTTAQTPSQQIDARIRELGDWRGERLAQMRALILEAVPAAVEDWKNQPDVAVT